MKEETIFDDILRFVTNRVFIVGVVVVLGFYVLALQLFDLQIVNGEIHLNELSSNIARAVTIPAQRGSIYDRYGRPLAVNQFAYTVQMDPSVTMSNVELNTVFYNFIKLLDANGEDFVDDLPITTTRPYEFTFYGENSETRERNWKGKNYMMIGEDLTAEESIEALIEKFQLNDEDLLKKLGLEGEMPIEDARSVISLRSKLYLVRFSSYNPITIAEKVGIDTVTNIEEDAEKFKSLIIDTEPLRYYPAGETMTHIVGYTWTISSPEDGTTEEIAENGYLPTDKVGKTGIERSFEDQLRGVNGSQTVIVNSVGRRVGELEDSRVDAVQGDRIYLTIDSRFQERCYEILRDMLKETLINRLTDRSTKDDHVINERDLLASLVRSNNISAKEVFESEEGTASYRVMQYVQGVFATDPLPEEEGEDDDAERREADPNTRDGRKEINEIIADGIEDRKISLTDIILVLCEQEIITADENYLARIRTGTISTLQVILDKIRENEITPQMANLEPSSGSLVVVDVKNGDVLAAPTYPTYDNNELINNYSATYLRLLDDPTVPLYNRPFREQRAPGSTFKMISAATGLETGVISGNTLIYDEREFTKAGDPPLRCWNRITGHGSINVVTALEVSCNYFFADVAYRIGNAKEENSLDSIHALNRYMAAFDLDKVSGVEIGEEESILSGPELKLARFTQRGWDYSDWYDGDSTATAIGQAFNTYTAAVMAKYTATIATKGEKYDLHLLDKSVTEAGITTEYKAMPKNMEEDISDETWDLLHKGMLAVMEGRDGTGTRHFRGFPFSVGGKTGTAEEVPLLHLDHTSFAGFAPYDDPLIAIYVSIPFSDTDTTSAPATQVARKVMEEYFNFFAEPELAMAQNIIVK